ncbi:Fe-S-cluster-containing dehydrogenase component/DMSO reductase anchor subunit [Haloferula luteola]|uniref:Fe-S-cluster-containing dehydrogenase component/DMSO reductase anchor subunit n=1 Tax=Haloferula luteola TaxID=595692 RepID=A0A840VCZ8_9BACT|nr:Fe-S-cluster-containing dehydrogenase component/DMSO reductase anchor subunit [Haloferula luteola]
MISTLHPKSLEQSPLPKASELRTLIDELIADQAQLQTPVARFAEIHDRQPDLADHYRNLIPLSQPAAGEQYAFEVSLDRCTGCKACVSACHNLNGLDEHEAWRDTGTLVGGKVAPGWQQTITSACHHCEDPGCLNGCPVGAYEKDPDNGIVRHLDDQCIGCSYCILKCPFDVPKYSKQRGIVRKCDMCHQRLAEGEAPACVQACPTEAIRIVKVPTQTPIAPPRTSPLPVFLTGAPDPSITRPTTRYIGRDVPLSAHAADRSTLTPQHAHWPLIFMLVLTQAGIGVLGSAAFQESPALMVTGAILFNLGMAAATLHLGQPLKAWRFFLGLRTSWLSREILAFSLFAPLPFALAALPFLPDFPFKNLITPCVSWITIPLGIGAIFTSVMIYHDTRRSLWRLPLTATRFYGTTLSFFFLALSLHFPWAKCLLVVTLCAKAGPEISMLLHRRPSDEWAPDLHSARLYRGPLKNLILIRAATTLFTLLALFVSPWLALPLLLISEIFERQLFFQAVQAPKMPGHFGSPLPH